MTANNITNDSDFRILILMPTGRDAVLVSQSLQAVSLTALPCADLDELESRLDEGGGAILLAEEALRPETFERFVEIVRRQPVWSDIPVVLLAANQRNSEKLLNNVGTLLNITILERPLPKAILTSAMRGALRAREKQYQTRDLLAELKEADAQKDLFLATLSHELRTPLNSMLGWIKLLKIDIGSDPGKTRALDVIERNAQAQTQIINDILLLSRIVTGKFEIARESIRLDRIIEAAIDIIQPSAKSKNIELKTSFNDADCLIEGDFERLQQVFWNLLSNAVKFTPEGGVISIEARCEGASVITDISDNGDGIKPDFLPFIFERFRQADNSYTRAVGGLGLGLAIVRNIIEQHGGRVAVKSDGPGTGATFTIELPRLETSEETFRSRQNARPDAGDSLAGLQILLVEDDEDSREMLVFLLRGKGILIEAVSDGRAALEAIAAGPPQLLISDVGMPEMDGYQLIGKVRELPPAEGGLIPAIALTGYAGSQDQMRAINSGYQAHLSKPIDFEKLFETIKQVTDLH